MTPSILTWLKSIKRYLPDSPSVLEVGSYNINGTPRTVFTNCESYVGVDRTAGPGVDLVLDAHSLSDYFKEQRFGIVICCEMLEHDSNPLLTVEQMTSLIDTGGFMIITSPSNGFPEHSYPRDYWRIMPHAYRDLLFVGFQILSEYVAPSKSGSSCICVLGKKN